tara:strand:- start:22292 stop:23053 length:762 start_codon:yes stop_codon:yes gene_type:complete
VCALKLDKLKNIDIIGDVHGCYDELCLLLEKLGYALDESCITSNQPALKHSDNRKIVFVGDLVDRGPKIKQVLLLAENIIKHGGGYCVLGNHEDKLCRYLKGNPVNIGPGLQTTIDQLEPISSENKKTLVAMLEGLPTHIMFDDKNLIVVHAGLQEKYHGVSSKRERVFALYGDVTGRVDDFGLPIRGHWEHDYKGKAYVVYGHTPVESATWCNKTICIDTGCVFGNKLTALRYPQMDIIEVEAGKNYFQSMK